MEAQWEWKDFGDGGAFPEIHVAQYPLGMGKTKSGPQQQGTLALQTDEKGQIRYDVVLHQSAGDSMTGENGKLLFSSYKDLAPMDVPNEGFAKPTDEELQDTTEKTREALSKIVDCMHLIPLDCVPMKGNYWLIK